MNPIVLDGRHFTLHDAARVAAGGASVVLADEARGRMRASRRVVEAALVAGSTIYGINTGFGRLADVRIGRDDLERLQLSLVRSHAAGLGEPLPAEDTRLVLCLRANSLAGGRSGVRPEVTDLILALLAAGILPVIPSRGSVGASGDLAPLAHLALVLVGEGEAVLGGARLPGAAALARAGLAPLRLAAKEGLSLINGTQAMTAVGARSLVRLEGIVRHADLVGTMTLDALLGTDRAFDPRLHEARPHPGQAASAESQRSLLQGSGIRESHRNCPKVQDAYTLRCMPQVHGAVRDACTHAQEVIEREMNAATDNPLVFADGPDGGDIISGGNFHGAPVALTLDYLGVAAATLGTMAERRIERLVNPDLSGLPPFLAAGDPGLQSGLMIAHVAAAALASESKVLAHPASVDSIPTSAGQEDHVSMGMTAALKLARIVDATEAILATECVAAARAIELRAPNRTSRPIQAAIDLLRKRVPPLTEDRPPAPDVEAARLLIREGGLLAAAEAAGGTVRRAFR